MPTTGGSGKLVQVKIRAISIAGGAQNETITRASDGGGEKRMVQEPIIRDLGGGMPAEITVVEVVEALRADLGGNMKFRIIAVVFSF